MPAVSRGFKFSVVCLSALAGLFPVSSQGEVLKVGAAVVDVTPEKFPVLVNGSFTPRSVSKVKTQVQARAIVIHKGQQQIAIMVVDSCMLPQELLDDVKQRVSQQTSLKPDHICISATHTHTAPAAARALGTDLDFDYVPFLREKLIQVLIEAHEKVQPAEFGWGSVMVPECTALRRWVRRPDRMGVDPFGNLTVRANMHAARNLDNVTGESGPEDPELSMIAFRSTDGKPLAVLANFSMHYFGDADISADYFGLFCNGFQQQIADQYPDSKFVAVMSHGCSGDIWRRDYRTWKGKDDSTIEGFADRLQQKALELLSSIEYRTDPELAMQEIRLPMKYRVPDAQKLQWAEHVLKEMETENPTQKFEVYAREQTYLNRLQETEVVVQAIRLGNIGIVTTPCETYALTGLKFKKQSPFEFQMVIELANGALGYIPPPEQHVLGGYNTWPARSAGLEVNAEPKIVASGLSLLERLAGRNRRSAEEERGLAAEALLKQKPLAYYRMADMAGPVVADASGHDHPAVYEPGVCFYLEGSALRPYTNSTVNRSAFFCGGRMLTQLTALPQQFTVQMDVWNGMPVDVRSVTGWFFSRDHASGLSAHGIHVGIGGTEDDRQGQLILQLGHQKPIVGKAKLERWNWYSIQLKRNARTIQVFLDDSTEPEIEVAFPESMVLPNSVFIGGRSDNQNNFEGRIDEVAFFAHDSIEKAESAADKNSKLKSAVSALDAIEAERGGRHWIDKETEPARSAAQSLKSFQIESGFRIELFASEPLVKDPVAITFDHRGDMYVVEYADYPVGKNGVGGLSRIVCLKDANNDHQADQRIVFADGLDFAHSLMAYRDGILVGAKTQLLHLIDTDGDGVADHRSVLFDGFAPAHPQMQIGMPVWGLDNRIYCNYGSGEVTSEWAAQTKVRLPRKDFWFDPVSHKFGSTAGLGQYGNTVGRWGNRFFSTNRNPIKSDFLDREIAIRNSHHTVSTSEYDVADSGGDSEVFPLRAMKSNYLSHAGTYTAACGTTAWLGPASSPMARQKRLADSVFVCEPIGHVVSRTIVNTDQIPMTSVRAETDRDFLASNDAWFRPSSLQTGPDGALYLADMYRLWVEHPKFLPKEIAEQIDWRAGDALGRIYRIVVDDQQSQIPVTVPQTQMDFVQSLASKNGWTRLLGQRLLVEESAVDPSEQVISALRKLCRHPQAETRLHALATLDGVSALRSCELLLGLNDDHPRVRQFAAKLASKTVPTRVVSMALAAKAKDPDAGVRMQTTVATRSSRQTAVINALAARVLTDGGNQFMADAILTSCHDIESLVLSKAISILRSSVSDQNEDEDGMSSRDAVAGSLVVTEKLNQLAPVLIRLGQAIGRSGNSDQVQGLLNVVISGIESVGAASTVQSWQAALLDGLAIGLKRSSGKHLPSSLPELLERAPKPFTDSVAVLSGWLNQNQSMLHDSKASVNVRVAAIRLLSWQSSAEALRQLQPLLRAAQSEPIQRAAVRVLLESGAEESVAEVLSHWKHLRPMIRVDVVQVALRRNSSTSRLLTEMQAGRVSSASLSIDQRARLLKHSDKSIRTVAQEIYPAAVSSNRQEVVRKYGSVVTQTGSREQGAEVFKKNCSACHRIGSVGSVVGPDLTDVRGRSRLALLHEILDPNSKVEPRFCACTVITTDGKTLTGILANETADTIQLRTSGGRLEEVSQSDIEEIITSDKSLMPEGLETDVTKQQMADLLAYLTAVP